MTPDRLSEIEARLEAATPGPLLEREDFDYYQGGTYIGVEPYGYNGKTEGYFRKDVARIENDGDKELLKNASDDIALLLRLVRLYEGALGFYSEMKGYNYINPKRDENLDENDGYEAHNALAEAERIKKRGGW